MVTTIQIGDYLYSCQPRWDSGRPHPQLNAMLSGAREEFARQIGHFAALAPRLAAVPAQAPEGSEEPCWDNSWFTALDAVALYGMITTLNPQLLIEVGSGNSTKFARRAIRDNALRTRLVSIDPQPRAEIDALCDEVIRAPAESVDPKLFARLKPGDVLFIDSSHRSFENSDVTALFLDVLPALEPGVIVHVHDIFLPHDYPARQEGRLYNEQYLLAALLLGGTWLEPLFACHFIMQDAGLMALTAPIWRSLNTDTFPAPSNSFWMKVGPR